MACTRIWRCYRRRSPMHSSELAARRRSLGISQAELGTRLGVSPNTIARWERGEMKIEHGPMLKLALQHLALEIEEERRNESPEVTYERNGRIMREAQERARLEWERMSEEERQRVRGHFGDIRE